MGPFTNEKFNPQLTYDHGISANLLLAIGAVLPIVGGVVKSKTEHHKKTTTNEIVSDQIITFIVGILFGCGLLLSGMVRRVNILGFLQINEGWNPSLLLVLGCGVSLNLVTFNYMLRIK